MPVFSGQVQKKTTVHLRYDKLAFCLLLLAKVQRGVLYIPPTRQDVKNWMCWFNAMRRHIGGLIVVEIDGHTDESNIHVLPYLFDIAKATLEEKRPSLIEGVRPRRQDKFLNETIINRFPKVTCTAINNAQFLCNEIVRITGNLWKFPDQPESNLSWWNHFADSNRFDRWLCSLSKKETPPLVVELFEMWDLYEELQVFIWRVDPRSPDSADLDNQIHAQWLDDFYKTVISRLEERNEDDWGQIHEMFAEWTATRKRLLSKMSGLVLSDISLECTKYDLCVSFIKQINTKQIYFPATSQELTEWEHWVDAVLRVMKRLFKVEHADNTPRGKIQLFHDLFLIAKATLKEMRFSLINRSVPKVTVLIKDVPQRYSPVEDRDITNALRLCDDVVRIVTISANFHGEAENLLCGLNHIAIRSGFECWLRKLSNTDATFTKVDMDFYWEIYQEIQLYIWRDDWRDPDKADPDNQIRTQWLMDYTKKLASSVPTVENWRLIEIFHKETATQLLSDKS